MKINKEYRPVAEALTRVVKLAIKEGEKDMAELLILVHTCHLVGIEKELMQMIRSYPNMEDALDGLEDEYPFRSKDN